MGFYIRVLRTMEKLPLLLLSLVLLRWSCVHVRGNREEERMHRMSISYREKHWGDINVLKFFFDLEKKQYMFGFSLFLV